MELDRVRVLSSMRHTFCTSIDEGFETFWVLWVDKVDESSVHPASCLDRVKSTNDEVKL